MADRLRRGSSAKSHCVRYDFEDFFAAARLNPRASSITGTICGIRLENIDDPLMRKIRYLDKLVDELAKGKPMDRILRA